VGSGEQEEERAGAGSDEQEEEQAGAGVEARGTGPAAYHVHLLREEEAWDGRCRAGAGNCREEEKKKRKKPDKWTLPVSV
jgi:hypothetical protein